MCNSAMLTALVTHCKQLTELRCEESRNMSSGPWLTQIFTYLPLLRTWSTIGLSNYHDKDKLLPTNNKTNNGVIFGTRPLTYLNISETYVLNNTLVISMIRCYPHLHVMHIGYGNPYLSYEFTMNFLYYVLDNCKQIQEVVCKLEKQDWEDISRVSM